MDHVTRCPNCSTAFRVTDEQLAAFQGKVRCGRCALVFNARDALLPPAQQEPQAELQPEIQAPSLAAEKVSPAATLQEVPKPEHDTPTAGIPEDEHVSVAEIYTQALEDMEATDASPPPFDHFEEFTEDEAPDALMHTAADDAAAAGVETPGGYHPIALPEDEALFAPLAKPRHARIWTFFALLAALVFVLQIVFAYRVTIAMEFPALQPRFTKLCNVLGCNMPLPRQAERLRLEWSELTYVPDHPTLIQLSATLRNLASFEQGLPHLELTLTDAQEHVVARRIFRPNEYLSSNEKSRRSLPGYDELHAFLQLDMGELKSTGYSLYWFYD